MYVRAYLSHQQTRQMTGFASFASILGASWQQQERSFGSPHPTAVQANCNPLRPHL